MRNREKFYPYLIKLLSKMNGLLPRKILSKK